MKTLMNKSIKIEIIMKFNYFHMCIYLTKTQ